MDGKPLVLIILFVIGCGSTSEPTRTDTITVPADTGTGWLYGQYGSVEHNPDCDSVEVFKALLERAESNLQAEVGRFNVAIQAITEGYSVDAEESRKAIDALKKQRDYYRLKLQATVVSPPQEIPLPQDVQDELNGLRGKVSEQAGEIAALKENQITPGWTFKTGLYGVPVGFVLCLLLFAWLRFRGIFG